MLIFPSLFNLCLQKTLNPVFDECFEFGTITLEQCSQESAMIGFTVMDHDVITANDFAGEAYLSLNTIPGVAELSLGVENFHGLKAIDLVLMQQKDKREFVVATLLSFCNVTFYFFRQTIQFFRSLKHEHSINSLWILFANRKLVSSLKQELCIIRYNSL